MRKNRKVCDWLLAVCAIVLISCPALATTKYQQITAPETKLLMEKGEGVLLFNVLSQLEFELHHIPGSVSIPFNKLKNSFLLPADKNNPLIFYCMGVR